MSVSAKTSERIKTAIKRFQPVIESAKKRDVNESDTVVIVADMLEAIFGYDKYHEITSEHAIRGTFCDLAIKLDDELAFLVEVKAIGLSLKDQYIKQAVDYAANLGVDWVGLTNGIEWQMYKVTFGKPIDHELVVHFNMLDISHKDGAAVETLSLLAKEGWKKAKIEQQYSVQKILNEYTLGAIVTSDAIIAAIRREIRRLAPSVKSTEEEIELLLRNKVLKREVFEGEKAEKAEKLVVKAAKKSLRKNTAKNDVNVVKFEAAIEVKTPDTKQAESKN